MCNLNCEYNLQIIIILEHWLGYEMLQALYDYEDSSSDRTLDFKTNDEFFIYRDVADKKSWCLVLNHTGDLGYVPYNYVKTIYVSFAHIINTIIF